MTNDDLIPRNYQEWKYCITKKCGIPLTKDYIEKRIAVLEDTKNEETKKFTQIYGEAYTGQIIDWFVLARNELNNKQPNL